MMVESCYRSFPHSLVRTSNIQQYDLIKCNVIIVMVDTTGTKWQNHTHIEIIDVIWATPKLLNYDLQ